MSILRRLFVNQTSHGFVQLIRYGMVVGIAAPIDLGGYILLTSKAHLHYVLAATISFTVSLVVNYLLSIAWVFTSRTERQRHIEVAIFALIGIVGLGLTDVIIYVATDLAGLNYIVSKLVAFSIVFFWSFGARRLLFNRRLRTLLPTCMSDRLPRVS